MARGTAVKMSKIDFSVKSIIVFVLVYLLSSCAWFAGGGQYFYKRYDPATNATIEVAIESTRKVESAIIHFSPDGAVDIEVKGIQPGPNNLAQALGIINDLVKVGTLAATP
jgi:hypothetical protein